MSKLSSDALEKMLKDTGIEANKVKFIIPTLEIGLARQAAESDVGSITLDDNRLSELKEILRIGAQVTREQSRQIVDKLKKWLEEQEDEEVEFLDEGVFKIVKESPLTFKAHVPK
ncbi:MAG: hypothetical protein JSU77_04175 [Fidelibacterota bacterium]|nr:MAG: hypothetical protein JSU77_04175 [Candidatus Neomarinimicrobiota bacterium]